jgi:hypothetical protein
MNNSQNPDEKIENETGDRARKSQNEILPLTDDKCG